MTEKFSATAFDKRERRLFVCTTDDLRTLRPAADKRKVKWSKIVVTTRRKEMDRDGQVRMQTRLVAVIASNGTMLVYPRSGLK